MGDEHLIFSIKRLGVGMLGAAAVFCVLLGTCEMAMGFWPGIRYFAAAVPLVLLMGFAWRRPGPGGMLLLSLGLLQAVFFFLTLTQFSDKVRAAGIMSAPIFGAGVLFLWTAKLSKQPVEPK
jgi:hypothetical protein